MEEAKLREDIRTVQEWESLGKAKGPRKGRAVGVLGRIDPVHLTNPPSALAPGRTKPVCNVEF